MIVASAHRRREAGLPLRATHSSSRRLILTLIVEQRVLDLLSDLTGSDVVRFDPDVRLFDLGMLDSLGVVELLILLSDELGVEIPPTDVDRDEWATPRGIATAIGRRVAAR